MLPRERGGGTARLGANASNSVSAKACAVLSGPLSTCGGRDLKTAPGLNCGTPYAADAGSRYCVAKRRWSRDRRTGRNCPAS